MAEDKLNYKLIYQVRRAGVKTDTLSNLTVRHRAKADEAAKAEHKKYTDLLTKLLGHNRFEVTNCGCMADGVCGHVYSWGGATTPVKGLGKRFCIYCGCDDFDD
jgi:hypothetical protein